MMEEVVIDLSMRSAPKDKYFSTYSILLLLGCGFLFPYNSFITAVDYFTHAYPTHNVEFAFPAVYTFSLLITMGLLVRFGRGYSFTARIAGPFVCFLFVMVAIPAADGAIGAKSNDLLFVGTLLLLAVVGTTDAIVQGSIYGLAGLLPPLYSHAVQSGNGVAGLVASILRIATKLSLPDDNSGLRTSSLIYFGLSAVTMLVCVIAYFALMRLPFTKYYLNNPTERADFNQQEVEMVMLNEATGETEIRQEDRPIQVISTRMVIQKVWRVGLAVCFDFFITLLGFPGLITSIPAKSIPADWYPIILISSAAISHKVDWIQPKRERLVILLTASRLVFILIFVMCVHSESTRNEAFVMLVIGLFGFSGGFFGAILMMMGPMKTSGVEREVAGTVMAFFLVLGLALGAGASWFIENFVKW